MQALVAVTLLVAAATATIVFEENFEGGNLNQWVAQHPPGCSTIIADPIRPNNHVMTSSCLESAGDIYSILTFNGGQTYTIEFDMMGAGGMGSIGNGLFVGHSNQFPGNHEWDFYSIWPGNPPAPKGGGVDDGQWRRYSYTLVSAWTWHFMWEDYVGSGGQAGDVFMDNIRICTGACPTPQPTQAPTLAPEQTSICTNITAKCNEMAGYCTALHSANLGGNTVASDCDVSVQACNDVASDCMNHLLQCNSGCPTAINFGLPGGGATPVSGYRKTPNYYRPANQAAGGAMNVRRGAFATTTWSAGGLNCLQWCQQDPNMFAVLTMYSQPGNSCWCYTSSLAHAIYGQAAASYNDAPSVDALKFEPALSSDSVTYYSCAAGDLPFLGS